MACSNLSLSVILTLIFLVSNYALFEITMSLCKQNKNHEKFCIENQLNEPNFYVSLCLKSHPLQCDHVKLNLPNKSEILFPLKIIDNHLRNILIECPNGCLYPMPAYDHVLNIGNYFNLNFKNGSLLYVTVSEKNISSSQFFAVRRVLLSCI